MKGIKKISLLSVALLSTVSLSNVAKAEKVCKEYTNYYFFSEINSLDEVDFYTVEEAKANGIENGRLRNHDTYFPELEGKLVSETRVCLSKNGVADGSNCKETWDLKKFYEAFVNLVNNGKKHSDFQTPAGTSNYVRLDNKTTSYFMHGYWQELINSSEEDSLRKEFVDYTSLAVNKLVAGSFLPSQTKFDFDYANATAIKANIQRVINILDYRKLKSGKTVDNIDLDNIDDTTEYDSNLTPFALYWNDKNVTDTVLNPALYKVVYQKCDDLYKATINYYYYKDGETKDRIKDENGNEVEPYHKEELADGATEPITSPELKYCTIVDKETGKQKDEDKVVTYKIEGKDFEYDVYYKCDTYTATINYYEYKDGKTENRILDDEGNEVPAYNESDLLPGYKSSKPVPSPELKGCYIVDENGKKTETDKAVTIKIDETKPKNFEKNVYYRCPANDEAESNNKTGDFLIYLAWAVGLGAIGYSVYYFRGLKKERKEEI